MFKPAQRKQAKLRLALSGPSGSGKTTGALLIAKGIGGKIAVLDTERGSASLYADIVPFDVVELGPPYTPERYIEIIHAAEKAGYDTLVIDSMTHEWNGSGGILEIVDAVSRSKYKGNSYAAWNEGTPRHQKFVDAMLGSSMHIISTMRSKAVYVETEKSNGKKSMEKQGVAPQQRDGLEYEFTAVLDISVDGHFANASKDRTRLFNDPVVITETVGENLREWLQSAAPSESVRTHVTLAAARTAFSECTTPVELEACARRLAIAKDNPDHAAIAEAYKERGKALSAQEAPPSAEQPKDQPTPISPDQIKAIQAAYSGWSREDRLMDISQRLGRNINSVKELSTTEASALFESFKSTEAAA